MKSLLTSFVLSLRFGPVQQYENMAIIPLMTSYPSSDFLGMREAINSGRLIVSEVSQYGSVSALKAKNKNRSPVLLLCGEEVKGAKQNRLMNTSILLKERAETTIPVSCTEAGRWSMVSRRFDESEAMAGPTIRAKVLISVSNALKQKKEYEASQLAVWESISDLSRRAQYQSRTSAMSDIFASKAKQLYAFLDAFPYLPRQDGIVGFFNGELVGLEVVPRTQVYKQLHQKLVKSYALDALLMRERKPDPPSPIEATNFLSEIAECETEAYKSVGYGWDVRLDIPGFVGSALVYGQQIAHLVFLQRPKIWKGGGNDRPWDAPDLEDYYSGLHAWMRRGRSPKKPVAQGKELVLD